MASQSEKIEDLRKEISEIESKIEIAVLRRAYLKNRLDTLLNQRDSRRFGEMELSALPSYGVPKMELSNQLAQVGSIQRKIPRDSTRFGEMETSALRSKFNILNLSIYPENEVRRISHIIAEKMNVDPETVDAADIETLFSSLRDAYRTDPSLFSDIYVQSIST